MKNNDIKTDKKPVLNGRNASYRLKDETLGRRFMLKVINTIVLHMNERKINFSTLAKKLGITRASVSIMFSGRVMWSFMSLMNVCDALDLNFQLILTPRTVKL